MDGLPGYDNWKCSPPDDDDSDELICLNRKCKWEGPEDELAPVMDGEDSILSCPNCGGTDFETRVERDERLYDEHIQQKLDEKLGK